ncbi:MAG: NAD-dependent epimerase/dehydratase family protein [Actinobacteria bacterium]|nr:NAD-dependent epimerase/dehydratase family protein [Actinomycetota bacterium]
MRVLVMGGTQFNGLALVHELVRQGHEVTVCNRGRTESDIPDSVGRLVADRTDHEQLRTVLGGTEWDCVHDVSAYHPEDVDIMMELFRSSRRTPTGDSPPRPCRSPWCSAPTTR